GNGGIRSIITRRGGGGSLGGQLGGSVGGFDMGGGQGLLAAAPEAALPLGGQPGFVQ
ncbi:unnamed protein product, partial [Rotaria sp. Silwood2]